VVYCYKDGIRMYFYEVPVSRNLREVTAVTKIKTDEEI
jgi:hypothetical protein